MTIRILLAVVAAAALAIPQQVERTLSNADILAMLKAGLAESTIARAIDLAAERGTSRFDTSSQALIELKKQGATARILDAMLAAEVRPKRVLPSTMVPGLPAETGVYYRAGGERWMKLPSVLVWPEIKTHWRGMTVIEVRRYVIAGGDAGLQVPGANLSFCARGMDSQRVWQLVKLDTKGNYREWRTGPEEVFRYAGSVQPRRAGVPQVESNAVAHDVLALRPAGSLEPGQYALTMLVPGQRWLVVAYEFAVAGR